MKRVRSDYQFSQRITEEPSRKSTDGPPRKPTLNPTNWPEVDTYRKNCINIIPPGISLSLRNIQYWWTIAEDLENEELIYLLYGWWCDLVEIYKNESDIDSISIH